MTSLHSKQQRCLKVLHSFTDSIIVARRQELLSKRNEDKDSGESEVEGKEKLALLDVLLQSTINGQPLSNMDIREEVDTIMFAGHDTTTSGIAFCFYTLAKYPEVQRKAYEEIQRVIGNDAKKSVTMGELNELHYLDLVIKETLRLFPSVPVFGREVQEDTEISNDEFRLSIESSNQL